MDKILVYTPRITARVKYSVKVILQEILGIQFEFTKEVDEFRAYHGAKINYSARRFDDEVFIASRNFLTEVGIVDQTLTIHHWDNIPFIYSTGPKSDMPFDIFSATFFFVSRYEEYTPHIKDDYERYPAEESIAFRGNFLQKPIVDIWAYKLKDIILKRYPDFEIRKRQFRFLPTFDIDNAYAYKHKGFMRTMGALIKSALKFDIAAILDRSRVVLSNAKDPYDAYEYLHEIQKKYHLHPIYFFLFADYDVNDKNLDVDNRKYQSLIKSIADYAEVGIHPSFASNYNPDKLRIEMQRLSGVLNFEIVKSRQHFLMLTLPDTYRRLIALDIQEDYTMGYASQLGFRAGTCTPFNFYDLDMEAETNLKVIPFSAMDSTLRYYMKTDPEDLAEYIKPLIAEIKAVDGLFCTLWHNESLSGIAPWQGWEQSFEEVLNLIQE